MQRTRILTLIVLAQFCCTSLWFAGNAITPQLIANFGLDSAALGHLTAAVQFGFIVGTLLFAVLNIADRFSPSKVFFICALLGAAANLGMLLPYNTLYTLLLTRGLTGFCLAGIYPVGMKIAADHFEQGLGRSLSYLVGALVLGTAFPHALAQFGNVIPWHMVVCSTTLLAVFGGSLVRWGVPNGPFRNGTVAVQLHAFFTVFRKRSFRAAAFGYFGHMWELYAFWAFVPVMLGGYLAAHPTAHFNISLWSFLIIGVGSMACVLGGWAAQRWGTQKVAFWALLLSGLCCLLAPWAMASFDSAAFLGFLLFWGMAVIADSPLFSTLVAQRAPVTSKGTALTIVNCIGFAITIVSIQLLNALHEAGLGNSLYLVLTIGPALGLTALALSPDRKKE